MKLALLVLALASVALSKDLSDKKALWDGMKDYPLASAAYKTEPAPNSGGCKVEICNDGKSISNTWVIYEDGPRILVCICDKAFMNLTGMAYREGQVPLAVRSSVATITAGSEGKGGGAWCTFSDIAFFGDFVPNVFLHESGHALDFAQGNMYGSMGISGTNEWSTAIDQSSCVPDGYAKTNEVEDWAQNTVLRYWAKQQNKPWDNDETSCMKAQLKYAMAVLPDVRPKFDVKSSFRIIPISNKNMAISTLNSATDDNSPLALTRISNDKSQLFKIMPSAYDWYIACESNSYKCIDNQRDDREGKEAIITYRNGFISMQHKYIEQGNGVFKIQHRTSGKILSVGCRGRSATRPTYVNDNDDACSKWAITDRANNGTTNCPNSQGSVLKSDGLSTLSEGQFITSPDCNMRLMQQKDGNLVLYDKNMRAYWATYGFGKGPNRATLQPDGNLVVYDGGMRALWASGTNGRGMGPYTLSVLNEVKLNLKDSTGKVIWTN